MTLSSLVDLIEKRRYVSDMTFPLSQVRLNLSDHYKASHRYQRLVLLFYFGDSPKANAWKKEVAWFTPESPYVRGKKGRLSKEDTLLYVWKEWEEDGPSLLYDYSVSDARYEEPGLDWGSITEDPEGCLAFMAEFHDWVAEALSSRGRTGPKRVSSKIDELLSRYGR